MHFYGLSLNGQNTTISELLSKSKQGDKVSCRIGDPRFLGIFCDVESRGIHIFPPLLSQSLSLSKVHQALHFVNYMVPNTQVLFRTSHMQKLLRKYAERGVVKAVVKEDRASMGMGIHPCWSLTELAWIIIHVASPPVVVQPMLENFREFRLVIVGDAMVVKEKTANHGIFWKNKFYGGVTKFVAPSEQVVEFAKKIMHAGKFPWAYIDLFVADDDIFLSEINLSGSNAELKRYNLNKLKRQIIEEWMETS